MLISGKSTVTVVPANDTVLVYDADGSGNKLGKATVTDMMQTLPAVITTSGVVRLATAERSVDSTVDGTVDATGAFTVLFDPTDVPSVKYVVMGNGREELSGAGYGYGLHVVSSSLATTGFNFVTVDTSGDAGTAYDPDGGVQFVVYGLTS